MSSERLHHYATRTVWRAGAQGPTRKDLAYSRDHVISAEGKPSMAGSADPAFGGNPDHYDPETMLVAALSSCHMLWYLHLCAVKGVEVHAYEDQPRGTMVETPRNGRFTEVVLQPTITIAPESDRDLALKLHERAHAECYIANSVNFPVRCEPSIQVLDA